MTDDYAPTGIDGADKILGEKGIPRGHSILMAGGPGSGKTTFAIQFLYKGATEYNEPGIYIEGHYGIRIENLIMCRKADETGDFLEFETMAVCPIDLRLIDASQIRSDEIEWLNQYHKSVREKLMPYLNKDEAAWLEKMTQPIG